MSAKPRETDAATSQETLGSRIALLCRRALVRARVVCPLPHPPALAAEYVSVWGGCPSEHARMRACELAGGSGW